MLPPVFILQESRIKVGPIFGGQAMLADRLVDKGHEVTLCTVASSSTKARIFKVFDEGMTLR